jgi:hypothetical protein
MVSNTKFDRLMLRLLNRRTLSRKKPIYGDYYSIQDLSTLYHGFVSKINTSGVLNVWLIFRWHENLEWRTGASGRYNLFISKICSPLSE